MLKVVSDGGMGYCVARPVSKSFRMPMADILGGKSGLLDE